MIRIHVSRRTLLKSMAIGALFLSTRWHKYLEALAQVGKEPINIIWSELQSCTGDTTSLLEATNPNILDVLAGENVLVSPGDVSLNYAEAIMIEWGEDALEILRQAMNGELDPYVLVIEGSIPIDSKRGGTKETDTYCYIGEGPEGTPITCMEWINLLIKRAIGVVTVGTCASYGGIPGNKIIDQDFIEQASMKPLLDYFKENSWSPSPTGAIGFFDDPIRKTKGVISRLENATPYRKFHEEHCVPDGKTCKPSIAVPGCPANGDAIVSVLLRLVLWYKGLGELPRLDVYKRPIDIYGRTVHDQCPRAGSYAASDFRKNPGDPDYRCLFALGCKGPIANCPWNKLGWVNGIGGPTRTGAICIGCTNPGFSDSFEPFYKPLPAPEPLKPSYLVTGIVGGTIAGGAAALGLSLLRERSLKRQREELEKILCKIEEEENERDTD